MLTEQCSTLVSHANWLTIAINPESAERAAVEDHETLSRPSLNFGHSLLGVVVVTCIDELASPFLLFFLRHSQPTSG